MRCTRPIHSAANAHWYANAVNCGEVRPWISAKRVTITPMKAYIVYGVYRLAARIHELREANHDIITAYKHDERGRAYAEYSLRA